MSYLEILLLALVTILPFLLSLKKKSTNNKYWSFSMLIILISHAMIDGFRWQMIPIYFLTLLFTFCLFKNWKFFKGSWLRKIGSGLFLFLLLSLGFLLPTILPVFNLPIPTGKYQVGSEYFHLVSNEDENLTEEATDKRELMIKVWYPAKISNEQKESYLNDGDRKGFATKYGLPKNTFNYLDKVETYTFQNPKVADGQFPILIFSPGYYSKASGYYALLEEIASHGFVIFNLNHTYESVGTLFPSDEIKFYSQEYDRANNNEEMASMVWEAMEIFKNSTDENKKSKAVNHVLKNYFAAEITDRWANDINLVISQIPQWEKSSFLSNHLKLNNLGVFGHSQGGAAAGQVVLDHPKISAGINLDGTQWGNLVDTFFSKPFLLLSSDWPEDHPNFNEYAFQKRSTTDFYQAKIKNTGHSNFMDVPFIINLSLINEAGEIEPKKGIKITSKVVVDFFNKYLNKENIDILEIAKSHSELEIKKINH